MSREKCFFAAGYSSAHARHHKEANHSMHGIEPGFDIKLRADAQCALKVDLAQLESAELKNR